MLGADENGQFTLSNVNPTLNQKKTDPLLDELNDDGNEGLNKFVKGMSKYLSK